MTSIAIVGIGYWGKNLVRVFSDIAEVSICVHRGSQENAQWLKNNYPAINISTDYEDVLLDASIDAVVIATPIGTHFELVRDALQHEKHVFVEKPLADSASQAKRLVEISDRTDVTLFVGYIFLHHPTLQPLLQRSQNYTVQWGRFSWHKFGKLNVNIFLDVASHPISIALDLFQNDPVSAEVNRSTTVTKNIDIFSSQVTFPNEATFEIDIDRLSQIENKSLQVLFKNGDFFYWDEDGLYTLSRENNKLELISSSNKEPLRVECQNFLSIINGNEVSRTDGILGHKVHEIIEYMTTKSV
jgi:UDP-2-acetamido-3-amino-2,3-dideoxy-glucuronate N-acetyltransferase